MSIAEGAEVRQPSRPFLSRRVVLLLIAAGVLLVVIYFVPSWLAVRTLTSLERMALTSTPADRGLVYEDIEFQSRDGITLRGWWIDGAGPGTVIMAHGKGSVRDDEGLKYLDLAAGLANAGYNVLMFDLRGHGESDFGNFTLGVNEPLDVLGAVDYARSRGVAEEQVALLGFSTGAVSALEAAVREPGLGAVIADGAWPNLRELLDREMASESPLPSFYNPGIYLTARVAYGWDIDEQVAVDDVAEIAGAGRHIFIIHGTADRYTSVEQAARLQSALGQSTNAEFWQIDGVEHVSGFATYPDEYLSRLLAFLVRAIAAPS